MTKRIYLDNGATTRVDDAVLEAMIPYFQEKYGNASSQHSLGRDAKDALENAREIIAKKLNANPREIVFTSGGTESNNFALKGVAFAKRDAKKGNHIIISKIEHDCVLNTTKWLEKQGFEITRLDVDPQGYVDLVQLKNSIRDDTIIVSIIHGNNEIGTIQDLREIGNICKERKVLFHTDACQSFTKLPIDVKEINVDLITINSHKIHGPKGVGALYIKSGVNIAPLLHGGGHEFNKRSGTENVAGIVGFAKAVEIAEKTNWGQIAGLRDIFVERIQKEVSEVILTGPTELDDRLYNNANFIFKFIEGEGILMHLDIAGISVSSGSACSSHSLEPSHVLTACGYEHSMAHGSIRFTLSKYTTKEEIDYAVDKIKEIVKKLRALSPINAENVEENHNYTEDDHDNHGHDGGEEE